MANRTFWKLGWKNILHNPVLNLLTLLQMTAVFFIAVSLTSGICSRFDDYRPFRQLLSSDGVYFNMIYGMNPETGITLNRKDLAANLQGDPDIAGMYLVWAEYDKNDGSNDLYYSADDALLRLYTPALAEGEWFPETLPADGTIPVVVSQNQYDLHPGDAIELEAFGYEEKLHGKIIGVMAEGARYISGTAGGDISAKSLYSRHYLAIEEKTLFLMPQSLIGDGERAVTQLHGALFVTYKNATADEQAANLDFLKRVSNTGWSTNADIRKYSRDYIFEECRLLFPILLAVFIMTVVGSMSVNALMAKRRLRSFAVFYIC